jgi:hypothetical protein
VLQRFERRLEDLVGGAFARLFKGQVEPVEIAKALQREADENRAVMGGGRVLVPNRYVVELGPSDHERLAPWETQLTRTLAEMVQEFVDDEGWSAYGDITVSFALDRGLRTGMFRVGSDVDTDVAPRQRPRDSLSAPLPSAPYSNAPNSYQQPYSEQGRDPYNEPYREPYREQPRHGFPSPPAGVPSAPGGIAAAGVPTPGVPVPGVSPNLPGVGGGREQNDDPYGYGSPSPGYNEPAYGQQPGYGQQPYQQQPEQRPYNEPQYDQPQLYDPPPRAQPVLVIDGTDRRQPLQSGSTVIGRGQDADLRLPDTGVSRRHAVVRFDGTTAVIEDLNSTNGTVVNGQRIRTWRLQSEDVIRVGHTVVIFRQELP